MPSPPGKFMWTCCLQFVYGHAGDDEAGRGRRRRGSNGGMGCPGRGRTLSTGTEKGGREVRYSGRRREGPLGQQQLREGVHVTREWGGRDSY